MRAACQNRPPDQSIPSPCTPPVFVRAAPTAVAVRLAEVPDDGNDDIYKYELQVRHLWLF